MLEVRKATPKDAEEISFLLRRSIAELCVQDHRNDPTILGRWASSKTPEMIAAWIAQPDSVMYVVVEPYDSKEILAVGSINKSGEVGLNYVHPKSRFIGASKLLMQTLEDQARRQGNTHCTLHSTVTARHFYDSLGYVEQEYIESGIFGSPVYLMSKNLTTQNTP